MDFTHLLFYIFIISALTYSLEGQTQNNENKDFQEEIICPGSLAIEWLSPDEQQMQIEFEQKYRAAIKKKISEGNNNQKSVGEIYTIPVVVHIIHNGQDVGTVYNPDEATVNSYIDKANLRFSHTQAGAPNFSNPNYGVDTEIQFCLASTDPNGNYTSGVVRYYSPEHYNATSNELNEFTDQYSWDTKQYLNIYVNYLTNYLGLHSGGIVYMRNIGFNDELFCHEVGHWLGLRHTFEGGCPNNDCLNDGDKVCDTPPKPSAGLTSGNGCTGGQNLCDTDDDDTSSNNPYRPISMGGMGDQPDMVENYMDYTQGCWNAFTLGQKNRMRWYYETYRQSTFDVSLGCNPQTKPNLDIAINSGIALDIPCGTNSGTPSIAIENTGNTNITSCNIETYLNGTLIDTEPWSGNLTAGEISVVNLNNLTLPNGGNNLEIRLSNPNGQSSDALSTNNSFSQIFHIVQGGIELELTMVFDQRLLIDRNRWELLDANGNKLDGALGSATSPGTPIQTLICADPGSCYTFVVYDDGGNGMCCSAWGDGSYTLRHPNGTILASGGEFGFSESTDFCLSDACEANGGDADNDGLCADVDCNDNDYYQSTPQSPGTACNDGNIATENDVIQADNCTCAGTLICPGYEETSFDEATLTHRGTGASSTSLSLGGLKEDVRLTISNINQNTGGNPTRRYIDEVTISYRNAAGNIVTYGSYTPSPSEVSVQIAGPLSEVIVSLADGYDGSSSTTQSITLGTVGTCDSSGSSGGCTTTGQSCNDGDPCTTGDAYNSNCNCVGTFADSDNDGVCNANDICPGGDDTIDSDGDGTPDACDTNNGGGTGGCTNTSFNFSPNPLTKSGSGSNSSTLSFPSNTTDVAFSIANINRKTTGKTSRKYIEEVTVTYVDASGATQTYGVYSGANTSSVNVNISGEVQSVTISIQDILDGSTTSTMSIDLGTVTACVENGNRLDNITNLIEEMTVVPNPTTDFTQVLFNSKHKLQAAIQLNGPDGKTIRHQLVMATKGQNAIQLDLSNLAEGIYFVSIQVRGETMVRKIVKLN